MSEIYFDDQDKRGFQKALDDCIKWGKEHQAEIGVVEMALGAAIITWGVQTGAIQIGIDVVGSKLADTVGAVSAGVGAIAGPVIAGTLLKSIFIGGVSGVAGVTMIPAIPVLALAGGGAAIFGAFGYTASSLAEKFSQPSFSDYVVGASVVTVGIALLIDGARRIVKDERVLQMASKFKDGVIQLAPATSEIIVKTWDELQIIVKDLTKNPTAGIATGTTAAVGAAIGSTLAAGSVTVLGSSALGSIAVTLGLATAPIWPIFAGGAAGIAVGYTTWKMITSHNKKRNQPKEPLYFPKWPE